MNQNKALLNVLFILTAAHTFTAHDKETQAGIHYFHEKKPTEAIDHFQKAIEKNPENKTALFYLGMIHYYLNNYTKSYRYYRECQKLAPANQGIATNIALVLTKLGMFDAALPIFEQLYEAGETKHAQRLRDFYIRKKDWEKASPFLSLNNYWWYDYDLRNKRVLVRVFHGPGMGFGDVFQFIRYAQTIYRAGAQVTLEAPRYLIPLLSSCPYIHRIITPDERTDDFDYVFVESPHVFLLELIKPIRIKQDNVVPYLFASQERIDYWRKQIE